MAILTIVVFIIDCRGSINQKREEERGRSTQKCHPTGYYIQKETSSPLLLSKLSAPLFKVLQSRRSKVVRATVQPLSFQLAIDVAPRENWDGPQNCLTFVEPKMILLYFIDLFWCGAVVVM